MQPLSCSFMKTPFDLLKHYFDGVDQREDGRGGPYKRTPVGQFVPSPLGHIHAAIEHLLKTGAIDASGPFLDAGSGDARIVALTALVHGIPSVGVEYDEELVERSGQHLKALEHLRAQGVSTIILPGDFGDDETYLRASMRFSDFTTVFNYINNESALTEKVARQSLPGTKLLLFGAFPVPGYWGLTLEQNLELIAETDGGGGVAVADRPFTQDSYIDPNGTYLQVYRR